LGSEEAGRLKAGVILTLATKSLTEPTKGPEKTQLYSVTSESSVRDKKVIFTGERGENIADYPAENQPNMPDQQATVGVGPCGSACPVECEAYSSGVANKK